MSTNTKHRKRHSLEVKLEAVKKLEVGHNTTDIATQLGIAPKLLYKWRDQLLKKGLITPDQVFTKLQRKHRVRGYMNGRAISIKLEWDCPSCDQVNIVGTGGRYHAEQCPKCHRGFTWLEILGKSRFYAMSRLFPRYKNPT